MSDKADSWGVVTAVSLRLDRSSSNSYLNPTEGSYEFPGVNKAHDSVVSGCAKRLGGILTSGLRITVVGFFDDEARVTVATVLTLEPLPLTSSYGFTLFSGALGCTEKRCDLDPKYLEVKMLVCAM